MDFVSIWKNFKKLTPGQQAEIRRTKDLDGLPLVGTVYRLLPKGEKPTSQWCRVIFYLPYVEHIEVADSLGKELAEHNLAELRLIQMVKSEFPNDLIRLRQFLSQYKLKLNWQKFGETLYYWSDQQKKNILMDYYWATNNNP